MKLKSIKKNIVTPRRLKMSEKFFKTFGYMMNRNIYYDKNDKKFKNINEENYDDINERNEKFCIELGISKLLRKNRYNPREQTPEFVSSYCEQKDFEFIFECFSKIRYEPKAVHNAMIYCFGKFIMGWYTIRYFSHGFEVSAGYEITSDGLAEMLVGFYKEHGDKIIEKCFKNTGCTND